MLKLGVGKFSLANDVLRRLLPVVPEQQQNRIKKRKNTDKVTGYSLVDHVPDPPSRDFEARKV